MTDYLNSIRDVERGDPPIPSCARPFWEATRDKRLMVQYDRLVDKYQFYPRPISIFTGSRDLEWREVSGRAELFSYTVARVARAPFRRHEPYLIGTVTLDVQVNVITNLVDVALADLYIGMPLVPSWQPLPSGMHMLFFKPA